MGAGGGSKGPGRGVILIAGFGSSLEGLRRLIHRRYLRAAIVGVSAAVAALSVVALALEIRFRVSHEAVLGYFSRAHYRGDDLGPLLKDPRSSRRIARLLRRETLMNPGGLVYAVDGTLEFHPHLTGAARASRATQQRNESLFPGLARLYLQGDLEGLLRALDDPEVRSGLSRKGVDPRTPARLRRRLESDPDGAGHGALRNEAGRLVLHFATWETRPYELSFEEKLRFYDRQRPRGEFVGIFEVHPFRFGWHLDEEYARAVSERSHYVAILPGPAGELVIRDFYRGSERSYLLRPVRLFASQTFYHVAASG